MRLTLPDGSHWKKSNDRTRHMPRPQFTLRAVLVAMLAVACFFGGIRFEQERRRREDADYMRAYRAKSIEWPSVVPVR